MVEEKTSSLEGLSEKDIFIKEGEEEISYHAIHHAIKRWVKIDDKRIPIIDTQLKTKDYLGSCMVRLGIGRYDYKIPPGLYGVGHVDEKSPVIVTANFKLTFDCLRKELTESGYWILVLDTKGINVWCAAGKGTFGSRELIYQINKWELKKVVKTRNLILPQLGATSMEPHLVRKYTGFKVMYGPVRSVDILNYIEQNYEADEDMRRVSFSLKERLVLTPLEIILNMKYVGMFFLYFLLLNIFNGTAEILTKSFYNTLPFMMANLTGSLVFPIILPLVPFRSFSLNGGLLGVLLGSYILYDFRIYTYPESFCFKLGIFLLLVMFVSYIAFNFTGSTTYTSFSGVKKETRMFFPALLIKVGVGFILTLIGILL